MPYPDTLILAQTTSHTIVESKLHSPGKTAERTTPNATKWGGALPRPPPTTH